MASATSELEATLMAASGLNATVTEAVVAALKAGLDAGLIAETLRRIADLIESE